MELSLEDIETLLDSLKFSIQRVNEKEGTPDKVQQENLERLQALQEKLRKMRLAK
jgi:hypothetical protein